MKARPLPHALLARPFSVDTAIRHAVSRRRLRAPDLHRPHRGARSVTVPSTLYERCAALATVLLPGQRFSHETAAELWGLPLPKNALSPRRALHVSGMGRREPRRPGIVGHRLKPGPLWRIGGLPVVGPVDAWVQCGETWALDDLVAMADALLGEWSGHTTARKRPRGELEAAVAARDGCRGVTRLRQALELARERVKSPQETRLRLMLLRGGLPEFELNAEVRDDEGRWLGVGDLVLREARLVIEYEGDQHRTDAAQWEKDIARRERFADAGWHLIRVTRGGLNDRPGELLTRVAMWSGPERLAEVRRARAVEAAARAP